MVVGFHAARSHAIVDMRECLVLTPALLALTDDLRRALAPILSEGEKAELHVTETDTGLDLAFRWPRKLTPALTASIGAGLFRHQYRRRIVFNGEILFEQRTPCDRLSAASWLHRRRMFFCKRPRKAKRRCRHAFRP